MHITVLSLLHSGRDNGNSKDNRLYRRLDAVERSVVGLKCTLEWWLHFDALRVGLQIYPVQSELKCSTVSPFVKTDLLFLFLLACVNVTCNFLRNKLEISL